MSTITRPEKSTNVRPQKAAPSRLPLSLTATRTGLRLLAPHAPNLAAGIAERLYETPRRHARPQAERDTLATARRVNVPFREAHLPVWVWSPAHVGREPAPVALLVHGWEGRGSQLRAFVDPLVARGFCVVAWDAPAHGDAPGSRCTVLDMAAAAARVAAYCGAAPRGTSDAGVTPAAVVIAHSLGVAASLTATQFGLRAARFALVAPPAGPTRFLSQFEHVLGLDPALVERMVGRIEDRLGFRWSEIDFARDASRRSEPALFVHDADDREVPLEDGAAIADRWPGARMLKTSGLGHRRVLRDPAVVREIVEFAAAGAPELVPSPRFEDTLEGELFDPSRRRRPRAA